MFVAKKFLLKNYSKSLNLDFGLEFQHDKSMCECL